MSEIEPTGLSGTVHPPREVWTDARKLELITYITDLQAVHQDREERGDKYVSDANLAMEAIQSVLGDNRTNGALRAFLEFEAREEAAHELEEWQ